MKQLSLILMLAGTVAVAACDDGPTAPSSIDFVFTAALSAANAVPPVTGAEAGATGTMTITLRVTRSSSNTISSARVDFAGTITGLPATGSSLIMAHVHKGVAGATGPVVVDAGLLPPAPIAVVNGTATLSFADREVTSDIAQQLLDSPSGFYVNVRSALNTDGVVRGQLARQH